MSDDPQIRASDFRRSWPNALARAMQSTTSILEKIELIESLQAEHQNRLEALGAKMPAALKSTEERLTKSTKIAETAFQEAAQAAIQKVELSGKNIHTDLLATLVQLRSESAALALSQTKFAETVV